MKSRAHSFRFAARFLPPEIRRDVAIVYAYYRTVDDLVDEPTGRTEGEILGELAAWEALLQGEAPAAGLGRELMRVAQRHAIPPRYLTMVLEGVRLDLGRSWIETRSELLEYSVLVAGTVGMVMSHILGNAGSEALVPASDLGVAMQLTNIIRDVGEDLRRGRLYLPREDLLQAGFRGNDVRELSVEHLAEQWTSVREVMRDLAEEASERYRHGLEGIALLEPSCRFSILLAAGLYSGILTKVETAGIEVLSRRVYVSRLEKLEVLLSLRPSWPRSALLGSRFGRGRRFRESAGQIVS